MRKALAAAVLALAFPAVTLLVSPAQAQSVTFTLAGGSLAIAEPSTATLTAGTLTVLASSFTGSLGSTTVTDSRGVVAGTWATTIAQTTPFTDGTTTIPASSVKAWVPAAIVPSGIAVVTSATYLTEATALPLTAVGQAFVTATAVTGAVSASFNPSIAVAVPANSTAGTYNGVITQTVS